MDPSTQPLHFSESNVFKLCGRFLVGMNAKCTEKPWKSRELSMRILESQDELPIHRKLH